MITKYLRENGYQGEIPEVLSTYEGISKLKNKTVEELYKIAEKEGLNPTPRKKISGTGEG